MEPGEVFKFQSYHVPDECADTNSVRLVSATRPRRDSSKTTLVKHQTCKRTEIHHETPVLYIHFCMLVGVHVTHAAGVALFSENGFANNIIRAVRAYIRVCMSIWVERLYIYIYLLADSVE